MSFLCFILAGIIAIGASCAVWDPSEATPPPDPAVAPKIWYEVDGEFWTDDFDRAQAQIPFPILLPKYFPVEPAGPWSLTINGTLREYQEHRILVNVMVAMDLGGELLGIIFINQTMIPPESQLEITYLFPTFEAVSISGEAVQRHNGLSEFSSYYFERQGTDISVRFFDVPPEEAFKVVESMFEP